MSKSMSVAPCEPSASGMKVIPSVQVVLGATVMGIAPQVPVPLKAYSVESDDVALAMTRGWFAPVLSSVTVLVKVWPTATLPNASDAITDIVVVGVEVGVAVGVTLWVAVGVPVAVVVPVVVAEGVAVKVEVGVGEPVGVAVALAVRVAVEVAVAVRVAVRVDVGVAVLVALGVGEADPPEPNAMTLAE